MVAIEEVRLQVEEAAQAKYNSDMDGLRREVAAQIAEAEAAALRKYNEAVENVQREATGRVAQAEENATKATHRAEAIATNAAEMQNQVQALMKRILEANTRAEVAEKAASDATLRAERVEEEVKEMKRRLETTTTDIGGELFSLKLPMQEVEAPDSAVESTTECVQQMDAGPSQAGRSEEATIDSLEPVSSKRVNQLSLTLSCSISLPIPRCVIHMTTGWTTCQKIQAALRNHIPAHCRQRGPRQQSGRLGEIRR